MSLDDRDYMRKGKLRWDERRGSLRLDEDRAQRSAGAASWLRWLLIVAAVFGVVGAGAWWYRNLSSEVPAVVGAQGDDAPESVKGQGSVVGDDRPLLLGTVTRVIDGDGIEVALDSGPIKVRFHSIDAPEHDQPWGLEAKSALAGRVDGQEVALEPVEQDQYDRLVAVVYLGGENLNEWLVQQGHAWAYRQYVQDRQYCAWEGDARSAGRGLWRLPSDQRHAPWEWRAVQRGAREGFTDYSGESVAKCVAAIGKRKARAPREGPAQPQALLSAPPVSGGTTRNGDCLIKGNIGGSGKIYHLPGSAAYEKTRIDESRGERWFCTEQEAREAGWRAPRG